jgi:hypothetical protein
MQIAEHHLIAVLPFAILGVVLACDVVQSRYQRVWPVSAGVGLAYFAACLYWNVHAVEGLRDTGGVGMWSNAVSELTARIEREYPNRMVKVGDWGFQDPLYVLSDGRINSQEIFWGATAQHSGLSRAWLDEIQTGGVFVVAGPENRHEPTAGASLLNALATAHPTLRRQTVLQRSGVTYAEIIDVSPDSARPSSAGNPSPTRREGPPDLISMGDPASAAWIGGFNDPENGARWTRQEFFVILQPPVNAGGRLWLQVNLFVADSILRKQGPMTLSARIGSHVLAPQRYTTGGGQNFSRELEDEWLAPGANRIDFSLDKVQLPNATDHRELGVVVTEVSIKGR